MIIRPFAQADVPALVSLWNACVDAGDVVYKPITEAYYRRKFEQDPNHDPRYIFAADQDGQLIGFIYGLAKKIFLPKETHENSPGYVTTLLVDQAYRRQGVGTALLNTLLAAFRENGKHLAQMSNSNPLNIDWLIPDTPSHDHNNAPGVDVASDAYAFFLSQGFIEGGREVAMYLNLAQYAWKPEITEIRERLASEGIYTGRYDASLDYDYDGMCDRIPSEYWRSSIATEIAAWKTGRPTTDVRFLPNGKVPPGPRPMLVATHDGKIAGFTGPVDKQDSGRGYFTGICTDPLYERRGIATVLFNLLMQEFVDEGATFSTLFTGDTNHAQRLYLRTGFYVAKVFAWMTKEL